MNKFFTFIFFLILSSVNQSGALWFCHSDKTTDEYNDNGKHYKLFHRDIDVYFLKRKPEGEFNEIKRIKISEAEKNILNKFNMHRMQHKNNSLNITFHAVKELSHIKLLNNILEEVGLYSCNFLVILHDKADQYIKKMWEDIHDKHQKSHELNLDLKEQRRQERRQEYEDFSESQGGANAVLMKKMGYYPGSDDSDEDY